MLLAIILSIAALFVSNNLWLAINVLLWSVALVALVLVFATIRDLRGLFRSPPRARAFQWAPLALADLAISISLIVGAYLWLEEQGRPPVLAEGTDWTTDCCDVDSAYDARLRQQFPIDSSEEWLLETLAQQDFEVVRQRVARASWWDLACSHFATVEWDVDQEGRLPSIEGDVGSACL
jgi:hypothetical protein